MSKTTKWVLAVIIIIVIVLVWWNMAKQTNNVALPAAVVTSSGLDQINRDVAAVDAQMQGAATDLANTDPTQAQISSALSHFKAVSTLLTTLSVKLNAESVNSKSVAAVKTTLADMARNLSNANSQLTVTTKNIASINAATKSSANPALVKAVVELKVAQSYLMIARADVTTATATLK